MTSEDLRTFELESMVYQARKLIDGEHVEGRVRDMLEALIVAIRCEDWEKIGELAAEATANFPAAVERFEAAVEVERLVEN